MGARPAEFEPTNLQTPSLCAAGGGGGSDGSLGMDYIGFEFFSYERGVMCAEQAAAL